MKTITLTLDDDDADLYAVSVLAINRKTGNIGNQIITSIAYSEQHAIIMAMQLNVFPISEWRDHGYSVLKFFPNNHGQTNT